MSKVVIRVQPTDIKYKLNKSFSLSVKTLSRLNPVIRWEKEVDGKWVKVPKANTKVLTIKKPSNKAEGSYRCVIDGVSTRVAKVTLKVEKEVVDPIVEFIATKENDAFVEIQESTGEDASPAILKKAQAAIKKAVPKHIKEGS